MYNAPVDRRIVARAIAENLQQRSITKIASVQNLRDAADYAAASVDFEGPLSLVGEDYRHSRPSNEAVIKIAECLITIDKALAEQGGGRKIAGAGPALFGSDIGLVMGDILHPVKIAMEQEALLGSTIVDNDPRQQNTLANSNSAEALLELSRKPIGYAAVAPGGAVKNLPQEARSGITIKHPLAPAGVAGVAQNEVEAAALAPAAPTEAPLNEVTNALAKMAMGMPATSANIVSGSASQQNTMENTNSAEGKQELKNKPTGYAVLPNPGSATISSKVPASAVVGAEYPHPNREAKVAEAYYTNVWNQLPLGMTPEVKLAAVENFRNSNVADHERYMRDLHMRYA